MHSPPRLTGLNVVDSAPQGWHFLCKYVFLEEGEVRGQPVLVDLARVCLPAAAAAAAAQQMINIHSASHVYRTLRESTYIHTRLGDISTLRIGKTKKTKKKKNGKRDSRILC